MSNRRISVSLFFALGILFAVSVFAFSPSGGPSESTDDSENPWTIQVSDQRITSDTTQSGQLIATVPSTTVSYTNDQNTIQQVEICETPDQLYVANTFDARLEVMSRVELFYDFSNCGISFVESEWNTPSASSSKHFWFFEPQIAKALSSEDIAHAEVKAKLKAKDVVKFGLTETFVKLKVYADSLDPVEYFHTCDEDSPAKPFIVWHEDSCQKEALIETSSYVKGTAKGEYHATFNGGASLHAGTDEHTSKAVAKITTTNITMECHFTPSTLKDLQIKLAGVIGGVSLECDAEGVWY